MSDAMQDDSYRDVRRQIHRASFLLLASLLLSRVVGFFREWILAQLVGVSELTDVYYASFSIPDFLNHLMAAGALSISFIPILSELITSKERKRARDAFRTISTYMGALSCLAIALCMIRARQLAGWIAPGFTEGQTDLLVDLIRIILPAQFFFYWGGIAIAVQQTHGQFLCTAIAPILYNLSIVLFGVLFTPFWGVKAFSIGVLVGSFLSHGVLQWFALRKLGYSSKPLWQLNHENIGVLKKYILLSLPIMLGFSIVIADEWISKYFASLVGKKAISWLSYARIELRIPVAVIGQIAGIASYPYLSRLWSSGDRSGYVRTLLQEIQKLWAFSTVAMVFVIIYALPITHFLFGGSRFTLHDFSQTAMALQMFGVGLVFWVMQVLLSRAFYSRQITWLPSLWGSFITLLSIPLYYFFAARYSFAGLALAGSVGVGVYCLVMVYFLCKQLKGIVSKQMTADFRKFFVLWGAVAIGLFFVGEGLREFHIYQQTQLSALFDVLLGLLVMGCITLLLLRRVFRIL